MVANARIIILAILVILALPLAMKPVLAAERHHSVLPARVLKVGEAFEVSLTPGQKIFISRKGFLAIHQLSPERFRLIALKKGELVVLVKSRGDDVISQRTVIIHTSRKAPPTKVLRLPSDCQSRGIRCRQGQPVAMSGVAGTWQQFFSLRRWCKAHRCDFRVRLSPQAKSTYERYISQTLAGRYSYEVLNNGVLLLCTRRAQDAAEVTQALDGALWQLPISSHACHRPTNYTAEVIAFRLKVDDAQRIGLNLAGQTFPLLASQNLSLHAFLARNRSFVIGHPTMHVVAGEVSEFATGSQRFLTDSEGKGQWKQVGFSIKLKVQPTGESNSPPPQNSRSAQRSLQVWYQVEITGSKGGRADQLDRSYMASTLTTSPDAPQVVAQLNTAVSTRSQMGVAGVDGIPIIGPLLRHSVAAESQSRLFLWLRIRHAPAPARSNSPRSSDLSLPSPWQALAESRRPASLE